MEDATMKAFVKAAKALGDPARVILLKALAVKPLCVCEATAVLGLAQSTVSKHLKVLEEAGLVNWQREGAFVNYRLATPGGGPAALLLEALGASLEDDPAVGKAREAARQVSRGLILKGVAAGAGRPDVRADALSKRNDAGLAASAGSLANGRVNANAAHEEARP
jgi:ArsR family transcriptional regulator